MKMKRPTRKKVKYYYHICIHEYDIKIVVATIVKWEKWNKRKTTIINEKKYLVAIKGKGQLQFFLDDTI